DAATCPDFGGVSTLTAYGSGSFALLKPTYIALPPWQDGWGQPMVYGTGTGHQAYMLASGGRDKSTPTTPTECGTTTDFNSDIVYSNGTFVVYPDGPQH